MSNRVLVVEDSKNISFMIEKCLVKNGFEVDKAWDGLEAMVKIFDSAPDIILLDILLPKVNGLMICEAVRKSEKLSSLPIIAMSAKTSDEDIKRIIDAGACDYIAKPFTPGELVEMINKHMMSGV